MTAVEEMNEPLAQSVERHKLTIAFHFPLLLVAATGEQRNTSSRTFRKNSPESLPTQRWAL